MNGWVRIGAKDLADGQDYGVRVWIGYVPTVQQLNFIYNRGLVEEGKVRLSAGFFCSLACSPTAAGGRGGKIGGFYRCRTPTAREEPVTYVVTLLVVEDSG